MPLTPEHSPLTSEQDRFLSLHQRHHVVRWQWHFGETMLRAYTERGFTATVSRADADELVRRGLMEWGVGQAYMRPVGTL